MTAGVHGRLGPAGVRLGTRQAGRCAAIPSQLQRLQPRSPPLTTASPSNPSPPSFPSLRIPRVPNVSGSVSCSCCMFLLIGTRHAMEKRVPSHALQIFIHQDWVCHDQRAPINPNINNETQRSFGVGERDCMPTRTHALRNGNGEIAIHHHKANRGGRSSLGSIGRGITGSQPASGGLLPGLPKFRPRRASASMSSWVALHAGLRPCQSPLASCARSVRDGTQGPRTNCRADIQLPAKLPTLAASKNQTCTSSKSQPSRLHSH